jgi:hypothetical protein
MEMVRRGVLMEDLDEPRREDYEVSTERVGSRWKARVSGGGAVGIGRGETEHEAVQAAVQNAETCGH